MQAIHDERRRAYKQLSASGATRKEADSRLMNVHALRRERRKATARLAVSQNLLLRTTVPTEHEIRSNIHQIYEAFQDVEGLKASITAVQGADAHTAPVAYPCLRRTVALAPVSTAAVSAACFFRCLSTPAYEPSAFAYEGQSGSSQRVLATLSSCYSLREALTCLAFQLENAPDANGVLWRSLGAIKDALLQVLVLAPGLRFNTGPIEVPDSQLGVLALAEEVLYQTLCGLAYVFATNDYEPESPGQRSSYSDLFLDLIMASCVSPRLVQIALSCLLLCDVKKTVIGDNVPEARVTLDALGLRCFDLCQSICAADHSFGAYDPIGGAMGFLRIVAGVTVQLFTMCPRTAQSSGSLKLHEAHITLVKHLLQSPELMETTVLAPVRMTLVSNVFEGLLSSRTDSRTAASDWLWTVAFGLEALRSSFQLQVFQERINDIWQENVFKTLIEITGSTLLRCFHIHRQSSELASSEPGQPVSEVVAPDWQLLKSVLQKEEELLARLDICPLDLIVPSLRILCLCCACEQEYQSRGSSATGAIGDAVIHELKRQVPVPLQNGSSFRSDNNIDLGRSSDMLVAGLLASSPAIKREFLQLLSVFCAGTEQQVDFAFDYIPHVIQLLKGMEPCFVKEDALILLNRMGLAHSHRRLHDMLAINAPAATGSSAAGLMPLPDVLTVVLSQLYRGQSDVPLIHVKRLLYIHGAVENIESAQTIEDDALFSRTVQLVETYFDEFDATELPEVHF